MWLQRCWQCINRSDSFFRSTQQSLLEKRSHKSKKAVMQLRNVTFTKITAFVYIDAQLVTAVCGYRLRQCTTPVHCWSCSRVVLEFTTSALFLAKALRWWWPRSGFCTSDFQSLRISDHLGFTCFANLSVGAPSGPLTAETRNAVELEHVCIAHVSCVSAPPAFQPRGNPLVL